MATKADKIKLYIVVSLEHGRSHACTTLKQAVGIITEMWNELDSMDDSDVMKPTLEEFRKGLMVIDANKLVQIDSIETIKSVNVKFLGE
jgi:hypothetical protein